MVAWLQSLTKLESLLETRPDIRIALTEGIAKAAFPDIRNIAEYFQFLQALLTQIPTHRDMSPSTDKFHYIVNCSPDGFLQKDEPFQQWLDFFAKDHGGYLDTPESAGALDTFVEDPEYRIEEYDQGPSGWMSFNQFFARKVKPGKRPVTEPCNDDVVVSAVDSKYLGCWPINANAGVTAKGETYSLGQLLDGSPFKDAFAGGVFTHSYLDVTDYHRFHVPVSGKIRESRIIPGCAFVQVTKDKDGKFSAKDEVGFQFRQSRGFVVIDSPVGLVAVIPIGMGHVSSVVVTAEAGVWLAKGEEFGYFCYGGSDMILLFQKDRVAFTATIGTHYKQGEKIASVTRR
jgi:phosphatidylserine decarboxylase